MILSKSEYNKLSSSAQKIVTKAIDVPKKQFEVGQNLINGQNGYPKNVQTGIQYLKEAIKGEKIDAVILYNRMLINGNKIECYIEKAKENLKKFEDLNNPDIIFLQAKIERKEENNEKSIELLKKAIELENAEAMFAYGQILCLGEGGNEDEKEAMKYFNKAKENGFDKGDEFFEKLKEKKKSKNKMTKPKPKNKSKSSNKKRVDIVF
ncbi:hypothetical protein M9Y10_010964 [Tritrichomonas musculus]|uniref:At2g35280-like TPR domain-containing protein n=1 Tax=Tritrichomonas musculus TaxID=1915356 RepID=A0ABR2IND6_9EUKA